jgi:hypothetical protein
VRAIVSEDSFRVQLLHSTDIRLSRGRLFSDKFDHTLVVAACGGMADVALDGETLFCCPLPEFKSPFMINVHDEGVKVAIREMQVFDLLKESEYRERVKADPSQKFAGGQTRLHRAAASNLQRELKVLLELGADVNARDNEQRTPLMWAARAGADETANALLAKGADPGLADKNGKKAADYAREKGFNALADRLKSDRKTRQAPDKPKDL